MDIPLYIYKYALGLAVILVIIFSISQYFKPDSSRLFKISIGWFTVLMVANLVNMIVTLNHYEKNSNKVGLKGPKGLTGARGFKGEGDTCGSICSTQGLNDCEDFEKDEQGNCQIFGNEINDSGVPNFSNIVKPGKCIFPFVHDFENKHIGDGCIKEPNSAPPELTDYETNGWCATELNSDKTPKKYAYCGESVKEIALTQANKERNQQELEMSRENTGILDIKLISGNRSSIECPSGYIKINKDLNEGSGGAYIYMCKKPGYGTKGVQSIHIAKNNDQCEDFFDKNTNIEIKRLSTDLNKDADVMGVDPESLYMCLGYSSSNFLTDIKVTNTLENPGEGFDTINVNLNEETDGPPLYIHTSKSRKDLNPLSSAFYYPKDKKMYFIGGSEGKYIYHFNEKSKSISSPSLLKSKFGRLPDNIDAVFTWNYDEKTYFFKGRYIYRIDDKKKTIEDGYPKSINYTFKGIPNNIDAVFSWDKDSGTYFFKDKFVYKYDSQNKRISPGYPRLIKARFPGVPNKVDAVYFNRNDGKTYFVRGNEYYTLDNLDKVSRNSPQRLTELYPGLGILPKINVFYTALGLGNKMYFFSDKKYYEYTNTLSPAIDISSNKSIFKGIPSKFDCVMAEDSSNENSELYFFKGSKLIKFNKGSNKVMAGFPKKITSVFPDSPSNIDACVKFEGTFYLFKNNLVYKYNNNSNGNLELETAYPKQIGTEFANMPSNIDAFTVYKDEYHVIKGIQYYIVTTDKSIDLRIGSGIENTDKYPKYLDHKFDNLNTASDRRNI
tara:strand:+ start:2299 stop:4638 length:2340 start_codon:yes stop_codon:yes gene_type:complete